MFAFKVVVSTIIVFEMCLLIYAGAVAKEKSSKYSAWTMVIVNILSFMAIWG